MKKNICPHCFKKFPDYNSLWYHTATLHSNKYNNSGLITNFNNNNLNQVLLSENKVQLLGVNKIENVKIIENEQNIKKEDKLEHEQNIKKQDKLEHIQIIAEINNLNDLICLAEKVGKEYKLDSNIIYNIDLKTLNKMLPELYDLNNMIGQPNIKNQVTNIILYHCLNLHQNDPDLLHTVIDGPPGTGKTEFAQKIAKIYLKMGLLTKDVFKKVRRSDLIAGFLGQTALKTSDVLKEVRGGVLFIDEAYSLGNYQGKSSQDSYSKECVDLINQSLTEMKEKKENYFILMIAGYKDDLEKSFFSLNDGLKRRFSVKFSMDEYTPLELSEIFMKKVKDNSWSVKPNVMNEEFISKHKKYFKYNGGDMELLFTKCKIAHAKNVISGKNNTKMTLNKEDLDNGIELFILNAKDRIIANDKDNHILRMMYN